MASFTKKATGWSYRATHGSGANRIQFQDSGFKTKREAQQAAAKAEAAYDKGMRPDAGKTPFSAYFSDWIETFKIGKRSASTDHWYTAVAGYIAEYYGDTPLAQIDRASYQRFIDWLGTNPRGHRKQPLSKNTINRVNTYVRATLTDAIENGAIHRDFTRRVTLGGLSGKHESEKYLSLEDFSNLLVLLKQRASLQHMSNYILITQAYTGARFEEAIGLTWDCVDFERGMVKIEKSWNYKTRKQTDNFGPLKNDSSRRVVPVPQTLLDQLQKLKNEQAKLFAAQGYVDQDNLYFRNFFHHIVDNNSVNMTLRADCEAIGAKNTITSHGLRHTHGSVLLYDGVDLLSVSRRLGHNNMQTTMKTYLHEIDEMKKRDDDKITATLQKI